jgi:hypothetical protein
MGNAAMNQEPAIYGNGRERLFEQSFHAPLDPAWEHWKYSVLGGLHHAIYGDQGQMLAHYAGFPRQMIGLCQHRFDAKTTCEGVMSDVCEFEVLQIGDVMVHPAYRGVLKRRGMFFEVTRQFVEEFVGAFEPKHSRKFRWIYGFPNERHLRIGEHHGLYAPISTMHELVWPTSVESNPALSQKLPLNVVKLDATFFENYAQAFDAWSTNLLHEMVREQRVCIGRKHAKWWLGRYLAWPSYEVYGFFSNDLGCDDQLVGTQSGWLKGLAAIRRHREPEGIATELLDCLAEHNAWSVILETLICQARIDGSKELRCWASAMAAKHLKQVELVGSPSCRVEKLPFSLASGAWASQALKASLWVTGGDTDFR